MAEAQQRAPQHATTKPQSAPGNTVKGAEAEGADQGNKGANEVDAADGKLSARIPPERPIPPGENQPGLIGGSGIEGSGNVEPPPYPAQAHTYPPTRDEDKSPEDRIKDLDELHEKAVEDEGVRAERMAMDVDEKVDDAKKEAERLNAQSEEISEKNRKAKAEAAEREAEAGKEAGKKPAKK